MLHRCRCPKMMRGFDSIESMHAEELLVKRKRGNKKYLIILVVACAIFFTIGILIGWFSHPDSGNSDNGAPSTGEDRFDYAKFIRDNMDKNRIRDKLRDYSSEPRLAGTALDKELAEMIEADWKANGLENVHLAPYDALLSFPNVTRPNVVQLINMTDSAVIFQSREFEEVLTEYENNSNVVPPFNGYSPPGNVTGEVVYVNYGRMEDFEFLKNHSIDISGKIVIARYGDIFRGDKVRNAELFNASAVILYSDPKDVNMENSQNTYPNSWWLPPTGIERGTVGSDGDPMTPLYPSTDYAHRLTFEEMNLPKIPVQPIGYSDAERILRIIGGPPVPTSWQGGLNFSYHIGPGFVNNANVTVRVIVNNYIAVRPLYNVIGYILGKEEPDRYVLLGNHHDAWVFGAVDPISGSAVLTEITRLFGLMLRTGHRPRRTIVFCSWDGEEYALLGSTEWVEHHLSELNERGVAYLNLDYAADSNYTVSVGTSPLLQDVMYFAATQVPSPDPSVAATLYDLWKKRPLTNRTEPFTEPELTYSLGSGSDMATFYQRAGVPSVDMWMTYDQINLPILSYPLYHSSYDTFFAYDKYIDPGFTSTCAMGQFMAIAAWKLAEDDLLPFKVKRYSAALSSFLQNLVQQFKEKWEEQNVNIDAFTSVIGNFTAATEAFQQILDRDNVTIRKNPLHLRQINDKLLRLERAFLNQEGLPGRPDQKHVVFAPSQFDSYVDNSFPGIVDTMFEIEQGQDKWEQLKKQMYIATYIVGQAIDALKDIGL